MRAWLYEIRVGHIALRLSGDARMLISRVPMLPSRWRRRRLHEWNRAWRRQRWGHRLDTPRDCWTDRCTCCLPF